jgi:hypothetical protein
MVEVAEQEAWEDECTRRINNWRDQLRGLVDGSTAPKIEALQLLKAAVDAQLALADLKMKARQADHAKLMIWLPVCLSVLSLLLSLGVWLKAH